MTGTKRNHQQIIPVEEEDDATTTESPLKKENK
jgi:hypothetical protein